MTLYYKQTEVGMIKIQKPVIGRIVIEAVRKFQGRVLITNRKGKVIRSRDKRGISDAADHFDVQMSEEGLDLRLYIAIRFGTSISHVTAHLIDDIKSDIEMFTGIESKSIAIVVTGMVSKYIAPRNIEVKG